MPIQLDPALYTSTYLGRFASSDLMEGKTGQIWLQAIIELDRNTGEEIPSNQICKFEFGGTCTITARHKHNVFWESPNRGSDIHKFVDSLQKNGNLKVRDVREIVGKTYVFNEDSKTSKDGKEYRHSFIAGVPTDDTDEPVIEPLNAAAATLNGASSTQSGPLTQDQLDTMLSIYAHGKTNDQIRQGVVNQREVPEFLSNNNYLMEIVTDVAIGRCIDKLLVSKVGDVYQASPSVQALGAR